MSTCDSDDGQTKEASEVAGSSSAGLRNALYGSEGEENPREQKDGSFFEIQSLNILELPFKSLPLQESLDFTVPRDWDPKVTVIVQDVSYVCNPMLLHAHSQFFQDLPNDDTNVIKLPDGLVTPAEFAAVYDWILAEKPELSRKTIVALYTAAKKLEIADLVESCEACFEDEVMFRESEAYLLVVQMNANEFRDIQLMLLSRITRFFQQLISSTDFIKMEIDVVCLFLMSENIGVNTEADVLYAAILWLAQDWNNRQQYCAQIMKCVEFNAVPPDVLQQFVDSPSHFESSVELVRADQSFKMKVFGGLIYNDFGNTNTGIKPERKDPDKPIKHRRRIFDPECGFHYKPYGEKPEVTFTFDHFLAHRKAIIDKGNAYYKTLNMFEDSKQPESVQD